LDGNGTFVGDERMMRLSGQFEDNMPHGRNDYHQEYTTGSVEYDGEWDHGVKDGTGTFSWPGSTRYKGQFSVDRKHGAGTLTWNDGCKFKGTFVDDKRHGSGLYKDSECHESEGFMEVWDKGELVSQLMVDTSRQDTLNSKP